MKDINQELEELKDLIRDKDEIIQRYTTSLHTERLERLYSENPEKSHVPEQGTSKIRIEYLSKRASRHCDGTSNKGFENYVKKLEGLVLKYEKMLMQNQETIE